MWDLLIIAPVMIIKVEARKYDRPYFVRRVVVITPPSVPDTIKAIVR